MLLEATYVHIIGSVLCVFIFLLLYRFNFNLRSFIFLTFSLYLFSVMVLLIFPIPLQKSMRDYWPSHNIALIPFSDMARWLKYDTFAGVLHYMGKRVLLFLPLGIYLPMLFRKANTIGRAYLLGLLWAFGSEAIKAIISLFLGVVYTSVSIDFVIIYSVGILFGAIIFLFLRPWLDKFIDFQGYTYTVRGN